MIDLAHQFEKYESAVADSVLSKEIGKVFAVSGLMMRGYIPGCSVGSLCEVYSLNGGSFFLAEVVGFDNQEVLLMSLGNISNVGHGSKIVLLKTKATVLVGNQMLGRVLSGLGEPIDDLGELELSEETPLYTDAITPMKREIISSPLSVGVRAIDGLLTIGTGQRMAIMSGSGVGKSMLLGQMARGTTADINVIALIGERGREVKEFVEYSLGKEGLSRSVVIAVTSDQSPLVRMRGAYLATAIAEFFAKQNKNVLLMMDSVTRFAMAQREIGLSAGEPPTAKGYTPSVFSNLPKLLERAGNFTNSGSITGLYTVLVEGDDMDEPIADSVRSIVDGHIVLDRKIAQRAHFPAIDVLQSTSRVMRNIITQDQYKSAQTIRQNIAIYRDAEDLINIGAYKSGANPSIDRALKAVDSINTFLTQDANDKSNFKDTEKAMKMIAGLVK
ncbi:MAG: FliI/YscN family ATPase [Bdellovibrionales bacterium]|jgi:flagellum-specific ATP synthase